MTDGLLITGSSQLHIYGLLHLNSREKTAMNVGVRDFDHQRSIYKRNALTLARSLSFAGLPFTLLTNSVQQLGELPSYIQCKEIPFSLQIPSGTNFYSAHHKIDVFRHLAAAVDGYHILCDLDVVCIHPALPRALINLVRAGIPIVYDVSDQVIPAFGSEVIIRDLTKLAGFPSEGRWYGGEFIGGPPAFFRRLCTEVDKIVPAYIANIQSLHHTSDEAIVTPALERLRRQDVNLADAGSLGLISRYWSTEVAHPQKPYAWSASCFLLHLPYDKHLLAEANGWSDDQLRSFVIRYPELLQARRHPFRRLATKARSILGRFSHGS
jgi:hypothetical protein